MPEWAWEDLNSDSLAPAPKGIATTLWKKKKKSSRSPLFHPWRKGQDLACFMGMSAKPESTTCSWGTWKAQVGRQEGEEGWGGVRVPGSWGTNTGAQRWCCLPCLGTRASCSHSLLRNEPGPFTRVPNARFQESHLNTWYLRCKETGSLYLALR